jgi:hypothetical protein
MPRLRTSLAVLLLLAGLVVLVERLIVTDAEAIETVVEEAADAAGRGDVDGLLARLDETYQAEGRDREAVAAYVGQLQKIYRPTSVDARVDDVDVEGDQATAKVRFRAGVAGRPFLVKAEVRLVRRSGGWRIRGVVPESWGP